MMGKTQRSAEIAKKAAEKRRIDSFAIDRVTFFLHGCEPKKLRGDSLWLPLSTVNRAIVIAA
jgi:hypothetical protein